MRRLTLISLTVLILGACGETVAPDTVRVGFDFFPLETGQFREYDVEEITFDIFGNIDTARFDLREQVVDSFVNQAGDLTYILHRSTRLNEMEDFELQTVWSARRNANQAVQIEENIPFIKISFPIDNELSWDGNALNTLDEDQYEMDSIFSRYITLNNDTIDNTLTVIQNDNQDFIIMQDRRVEIYGLNIGLVSRQSTLLNYCDDPDCIGQQIIETGSIITQTITAYGKE
ncbi:MAG: hypothetical protein AAFX87_16285 [Bacteroidota bacterium]